MKVIQAAAELKPGAAGACVAMGVFDGVHLGHQRVITQACAQARHTGARAVVVTFDRHPNVIVSPQNIPPLIYPLSQKLKLLEAMGVDAVWIIPFDRAFSERSGDAFIRAMAHDFFPLRGIAVGETFQFGSRRSGNIQLLQSLGQELGFAVTGLADVSWERVTVSSTRIRDAIRLGEFAGASQLLGRPYALCGTVVAGQQLGRKLGFPTANLDASSLLLPPLGVYPAMARVKGVNYKAAVNVGQRPTVAKGGGELYAEAHMLNFSADIYGEEIELTLYPRLRPEKKFAALEDLRQQIGRDVAQVNEILPSLQPVKSPEPSQVTAV